MALPKPTPTPDASCRNMRPIYGIPQIEPIGTLTYRTFTDGSLFTKSVKLLTDGKPIRDLPTFGDRDR